MRYIDANDERVHESASDGGARLRLQRLRLAPSIQMLGLRAVAWLDFWQQIRKMRVESADAVLVDERRKAGREHRRRRRRVVVKLCDDDHSAGGLADMRLERVAAAVKAEPRKIGRQAIFENRVE